MIQDVSLLFHRVRLVVWRLVTRKMAWPELKDCNPYVNWEEISMQSTEVLTLSQGKISGYMIKIIFPLCGFKLITAFEYAAYCGPLLAKSFSLFPVIDNDSGQPINVDKISIPADRMRAYFENCNGLLNGGRGTCSAERCIESI